jgi:hypothetical protein
MRYSQYFTQAAKLSGTDAPQAEKLLREAEKHASAYFPADLILCAKAWKLFLHNAEQAERCLLKAEAHTRDGMSFAELTDAWEVILNDRESSERCRMKFMEKMEENNCLMNVKVLPRIFFEQIKGSPREKLLLEQNKSIIVNASWDKVLELPFSECHRNHENLLCLTIDDAVFPKREISIETFRLTGDQAEEISCFASVVCRPPMPLVILCSSKLPRAQVVGEILNHYYDHFTMNKQEKELDFR